MTYVRQWLVVLGIGGALLSSLLPGCTRLLGREETPPPVVTPQAQEAAPKPEGPKVEQVGEASWYGPAHQGQETASGDTFDPNELTAAHPTLPLGTQAVVTNLETGKSVAVTITDRRSFNSRSRRWPRPMYPSARSVFRSGAFSRPPVRLSQDSNICSTNFTDSAGRLRYISGGRVEKCLASLGTQALHLRGQSPRPLAQVRRRGKP